MSAHRQWGARVRQLREAKHWSQQQLAQKLTVSQKHLSRLEHGDVLQVERDLLIRIAEVFGDPLATGELNQWLYGFGYRPHVLPQLPLPPDYQRLLDAYLPYPASIIDVGWFIRHWNRAMERFYRIPNGQLKGLGQNWLVQYFHPQGVLRHTYSSESIRRVLGRLFWEWYAYYDEPWNRDLRQALEQLLGLTWEGLIEQYRLPIPPVPPPWDEPVWLRQGPGLSPLRFRAVYARVPHRPDLRITVYEPDEPLARAWCERDGSSRLYRLSTEEITWPHSTETWPVG
ncbi:MAG: helix-turn-helix domain-containing protein [Sulfobacillus sp.]|nr:helix-turn-helix domain-containing protein [Sulfobacillus sp.]